MKARPEMSVSCCQPPDKTHPEGTWRRVLWIALAVNAAMFGVEIIAGWQARSVSLQADALDFFGDAANYAVTLMVLGMGPLWRSGAGLVKGLSMGLFGLWVLGMTVLRFFEGEPPLAEVMGVVGLIALCANLFCAFLLYRFRSGDSNMRAVWLCSRNDALANLAVIAASAGVWATQSAIPDLLVGGTIAALALWASVVVIRQAMGEMKQLHSPA